MRVFKFAIAMTSLVALAGWNGARADDCTPVAQTQTHELALFTGTLTRIKSCGTAEGRVAYQEAVAAWQKLHERDAELVRLCPPTDARFEYAHKTIKNLASFYRAATSDCGP